MLLKITARPLLFTVHPTDGKRAWLPRPSRVKRPRLLHSQARPVRNDFCLLRRHRTQRRHATTPAQPSRISTSLRLRHGCCEHRCHRGAFPPETSVQRPARHWYVNSWVRDGARLMRRSCAAQALAWRFLFSMFCARTYERKESPFVFSMTCSKYGGTKYSRSKCGHSK